ncbi:MAG: GAF domain-containing protein [Bacteroidaceae bacterium]|nr:GAF domain-containing protein [Bacteroidaceae bacterium]
MAEQLIIKGETKQERYEALLPQIKAVVEGEADLIANMANVAAMLHETFGFWWTGFYRVVDEELVLGPFQGPMACTRIKKGRGVCGTAWLKEETQVVPDVDKFPGHIACSSASRSEIVVPVFHEGEIIAVLDIDSAQFATFDETDRHYLERIMQLL